MIRLFNVPKVIITVTKSEREYEYSCKHCGKPIKWDEVGQLSPFNCPGCREKLADLSKMIRDDQWRVRYHQEGEAKVTCGSSGLP